jgi:hypothetical protein
MTLLDFLNPGSLIDSGALGRIQFGLLHFALGFAAVWVVRRLTRRTAPGGVGIYALAVLAPVCGLVLASVSYQSSGCLPNPEFCVSFAIGFPFRVACAQHDPAIVRIFDACGALSSSMVFSMDSHGSPPLATICSGCSACL